MGLRPQRPPSRPPDRERRSETLWSLRRQASRMRRRAQMADTTDIADVANSGNSTPDEHAAYPRKRLLLLMTPATYRAGAYLDAANTLDVEMIRGLDLPRALAEEWGVQLALDFNDVETAVATLKEAHARQPFDAIVPVDDSATILAAR